MAGEDGGQDLNRNYFSGLQRDEGALRLRIGTEDEIENFSRTLRGGSYRDEKGQVAIRSEFRLMNESGVNASLNHLSSGVNRINHLTIYKNYDHVKTNLKSSAVAYLFELVLNAKKWGPREGEKVKNKHTILLGMESRFEQSTNRGVEGKEAEMTSKQYVVQEIIDRQSGGSQPGKPGMFGRLFGRGGDGQ